MNWFSTVCKKNALAFFFIAFIFFEKTALAQGLRGGPPPPEFSAKIEAPEVTVGTNFEVIFELKNGEGRSFRPPAFSGFKKVAGPSTQNSVSIINGKYSVSQAWTYILQAVQEGTFSIAEATVSVGSQVLRSQPVTLRVTASGSTSGSSPKVNVSPGQADDDLFVAAELSSAEAWPGQQVTLNYNLYNRIPAQSYDVLAEPKYSGFFARELQRFDAQARRVTLRGKEYIARTIRSVALFPQQAGVLTIEPMRFQFQVTAQQRQQDPFSIFFGGATEPRIVETEPITLKVKALPSSAPPDFSGVVGRYTLEAKLDKNALSTDDALTLQLTINGNGDGKRLNAPALRLPPELEAYDPQVVEDEVFEKDGQLRHQKTFEYAILPTAAGEFSIGPELVVFDPDSNRYMTKRVANSLKISVSQGKQGRRPGLAEGVGADLSPLRPVDELEPRGRAFVFSPLFWVLAFAPFLALTGFYFFEKNKKRRAEELAASPDFLKKQTADAAHARLSHARVLQQAGQSQAFFDEIARALNDFLTSKFGIPQAEMGKTVIRQKLSERQIPAATTDALLEILQICEMARFAGQPSAGRMEEVFKNTDAVVRALDF